MPSGPLAASIPDLEITVAREGERPTLANLFQLYIHDFSELIPDRPEFELGPDGRFRDYPLDAYWSGTAHVPLLMRVSGRLVGFALLDQASRTGQPVDRNMREFFIARTHRRKGVGTAAAQALFSRYPGRWETAVARSNTPALSFWRRAIRQHANARDERRRSVPPRVYG